MTPAGVVVLLVAIVIVGVFATMTAVGQRRRGGRPSVVALAGLFFPLAWIGWYLHDELQTPRSSP